jgi:prepilin-type processing-associated H-X9-DG protein
VYLTKPFVTSTVGCPSFKTDKILGGRAIAADSFFRTDLDTGGMVASVLRAGHSKYHHREGYNVLYGDGHSAWYGDPQQRIMWMNNGPATNGNPTSLANCVNFYSNLFSPACTFATGPAQYNYGPDPLVPVSARMMIYHLFDNTAGYDVGTRPRPDSPYQP